MLVLNGFSNLLNISWHISSKSILEIERFKSSPSAKESISICASIENESSLLAFSAATFNLLKAFLLLLTLIPVLSSKSLI